MKTTQFLFIIIPLFFFSSHINAQDSVDVNHSKKNFSKAYRFYAGAFYHYAFGALERSVIGHKGTLEKQENVYGSYGQGNEIGINTGYMLNQYIGVEIAYSSLEGKTFTTLTDDPNTYSKTDAYVVTDRLVASALVTCGNKFKPYFKFGVVLGFNSSLIKDYYHFEGSTVYWYSVTQNFSYDKGKSFGIKYNLGCDYSITNHLSLFVETIFITQTWAPERVQIDQRIEDSVIGSSISSKTVTLVDAVTDPSGNQMLKEYFPLNSFGMAGGFTYFFGQGKK